MKGFDVLKVKSAVKTRNKFDLSRTHLTTMNFGEIVPLFSEETIPGDKIAVKGDFFSRLAPLVRPTYGKFQFKTVAGYVPYHMLANDADAWFAGKTSWEGVTPVQRYTTIRSIATFVKDYCTTTEGATSANTDFTYFTVDGGSPVYSVFTPQGKYYVKVLNALGYAIPSAPVLNSGSNWYNKIGATKLSAYPLLAFFKLYNDYMSQSQRFNTSALSNLLNAIKYNRVTTDYIGGGIINTACLNIMFSNLFLNYENDYFTSAWQSPNAPLATPENVTSVVVPNSQPSAVIDDASDTKVQLDAAVLSQRALNFLKSFDDWVRRNNYSGSRAVQQVYSRFGIKTSDYRDHYAHVLGTDSMPIQVGDVTSTADSGAAILGDYAGKGIMSGSKGISMEADDYGILLIIGYFTVTPMNPYGYDRKVLRNTPLDYYNPEFDGIGADPISVGEYFTDPTTTSRTVADNATYGFTERYNSYRYGRDMITGEFRNYRNNADMNTWHTGRLMGDIRNAGNLVAQSSSVNTLPQTDSEYNRIFSVTDGNIDHFYLTAHFDVSAMRPMLNLNQVPQLGEGDTVVPRNGNVIS